MNRKGEALRQGQQLFAPQVYQLTDGFSEAAFSLKRVSKEDRDGPVACPNWQSIHPTHLAHPVGGVFWTRSRKYNFAALHLICCSIRYVALPPFATSLLKTVTLVSKLAPPSQSVSLLLVMFHRSATSYSIIQSDPISICFHSIGAVAHSNRPCR